ncbi:NHL repeat-containing protein [Mucilaginibacter frigoritolerans]|uniref:NHL repeat-containing protein n=1 Tax=Mucilaginibacter frigoritolerans TaxID=652788 RepID=A0A562TUD7_9SPHI|nr:hypothetical protein [Mucilaginibacter frigoritolerans]TWI97229.1 NHL repeat-containing protein [Mucilaginibacter frigoritolerans]
MVFFIWFLDKAFSIFTIGYNLTNGKPMKAALNQFAVITIASASCICFLANCSKKHDVVPIPAETNTAIVSTFAGNNKAGWTNGLGTAASFWGPTGTAVDQSSGNIYVTEPSLRQIRKITPDGLVSLFAGQVVNNIADFPGIGSSIDGTGTAASFDDPTSITVDGSGTIYVLDDLDSYLRKITPGGVVTTIVVKDATTNLPFDLTSWFIGIITADVQGNIYAAVEEQAPTYTKQMIYKITPDGLASFIAGDKPGFNNGNGSAASFNGILGMVADASGNLYVTDYGNHQIRKISSNGEVSTFVGNVNEGYKDGTGTAAYFNGLNGITIDNAGNLYVTDEGADRIRKITPAGVVTTVAGTGSNGLTTGPANREIGVGNVINGPGSMATFYQPEGIAADASGNLYIADFGNVQIRKVAFK